MKNIALVILMISSITICGCLRSNTSDHEEEEENKPATYSFIMLPGSIQEYRTLNEITNLTPVLHDDGDYLNVSGDCIIHGRGVIFSNFSGFIEDGDLDKVINVTLVIDYKAPRYTTQGFVQWSKGGSFVNTTIHPRRTQSDVTERSIIMDGNFSYDELKDIKVRFFNGQGGIMQLSICFDTVFLEVFYH